MGVDLYPVKQGRGQRNGRFQAGRPQVLDRHGRGGTIFRPDIDKFHVGDVARPDGDR